MSLNVPQLPRAKVGAPVTAQAWNELLKGIDGFYDALDRAGSDYVQIRVAYRQGPVDGARVVGVPVSTRGGAPVGPPSEAAPDGGQDGVFQLPVTTTGIWRIYVDAPGFAALDTEIEVTGDGAVGEPVDVELVQTHLIVPDVIGFLFSIALTCGEWHGFGGSTVGDEHQQPVSNGIVDLQGPIAGTAVRLRESSTADDEILAGLHMRLSPLSRDDHPFEGPNAPRRTIVPDLLGYGADPVRTLSGWGLEGKVTVTGSTTGDEPRVARQRPRPGAIVPVGTSVDLRLIGGDPATMKLSSFEGTHRQLGDRPATELSGWVRDHPAFGYQMPWVIGRLSVSDSLLATITDKFDELEAPISSRPGEGLAEAWETLRVAIAFKDVHPDP